MRKSPLNLDERSQNIILRICTVLYAITLLLLIGAQFYRQFVLGQPTEQWQDIANIITFNVLVLIGAALYLGGIAPQKVKIWHIIALYVGFVVVGLIFTVFKYSVLLKQEVSLVDFKSYFIIVSVICVVLVIGWGLLAYLGNRRIEKRLED